MNLNCNQEFMSNQEQNEYIKLIQKHNGIIHKVLYFQFVVFCLELMISNMCDKSEDARQRHYQQCEYRCISVTNMRRDTNGHIQKVFTY